MSDPLDAFRDLRGRRDSERFIVEGHTAVARLLGSSWEVEQVVGTPAALGRLDPAVLATTRVHERSASALRDLVGFDFHRGCLASGPRPAATDAGTFTWRDLEAFRVAFAVGLADPRNLGALIRNARAFGIDHVFVDRAGADPLSRLAIRASMGHVFTTSWSAVEQPFEAASELARSTRATIWAATSKTGAIPLVDLEPPARLALAFGNEGDGLPAPWLHGAERVAIELDPGADSLNVAAAAAVFFHAIRLPRRSERS